MNYIRTNGDYYRSLGESPERAQLLGHLADQGEQFDEGYCNPIKLRAAQEQLDRASEELGPIALGRIPEL